MLRKEFGNDIAKEVLDAHEDDPEQDQTEKSMDLANNRAGLIAAGKLMTNSSFSEEALVADFVSELKAGHLIVTFRKIKSWKELKP